MSTQAQGDSSRFGHRIALLTVGAVYVWFAWPWMTMLAHVYAGSDDYSHGFMVPLVSLITAYEISRNDGSRSVSRRWLGVLLVVIGVLTVLFAYWYQAALMPLGLGVAFLIAVGLWTIVIGMVAACSGVEALRRYAFPLTYLVFAVPFPTSMTLPLTATLRALVSEYSEVIIRFFGVTVYREGNVLHLASTSLGVEDACSGIRSFWMLMAGAALVAYVFRFKTRHILLICLASIPVSVLTNVLRILVTALIATQAGGQYVSGRRHEFLGALTFLSGVAVIMLIALAISRTAKADSQPRRAAPVGAQSTWSFDFGSSVAAGVIGVMLAGGGLVSGAIDRHYFHFEQRIVQNRRALQDFPNVVENFVAIQDRPILAQHLKILQSNDHLVRVFSRTGHRRGLVELRIIYWQPSMFDRTRPMAGLSGHIPDNCFSGWGFVNTYKSDHADLIDDNSEKIVHERVFSRHGDAKLVLFWTKRRYPKLFPRSLSGRLSAMLKSLEKPYIDHGSQYIVTVIVDIDHSLARARATAFEFTRIISGILPEYGLI